MPVIETTVECPVHDSFNVKHVSGMFDLPPQAKASVRFAVEVPDVSEAWQLGAIVGPSGSGKTTVARATFPANYTRGCVWPPKKAVIDGFGKRSVEEISNALIAVGFSEPPAWVKPFGALSTGQQFRCDLARSLLGKTDDSQLVVFDEFSSLVDRTVAKIGSYAVAKAIRNNRFQRRFVAVTCHYDVLDWLEPDWVLDMAERRLARRWERRRPEIVLEISRCGHGAWRMFGPHHYLANTLNRSCRCYLLRWQGEPVGFCALIQRFGRGQSGRRVSRIVVLPDYQGIGIGGRFLNAVAALQDCTVTITTSHPSMIHFCKNSPHWRCHAISPMGTNVGDSSRPSVRKSRSYTRATVSFTYRKECG